MTPAIATDLRNYVRAHSHNLIQLLRDLVALPSENKAPQGCEGAVQRYVAGRLQACGYAPVLYRPDAVPGIREHAGFWPGRDYTDRPNVNARIAGTGGGRSLVLSGHADTVPIGSSPWTVDPFGGQVDGNRLYGRGSNDMKSGIAMNLFVVEALRELGIQLRGDLIFESVVDEEFGGVNGTLAGRLMGFNADAAIITESTGLRICPAQRGGRLAHITLHAPNQGILGKVRASAVEQLRVLLNAVTEFQAQRLRQVRVHPLYAYLANPVPASVIRVFSAPWGTGEPPNIPSTCKVELFWEAMPGESQEEIDREFHLWFHTLVTSQPDTFGVPPTVEFPIRWLPGSAWDPDHDMVGMLAEAARQEGNPVPPVQGIEGPCDLYVFHQMGIPAVLWGPRGGNTHNPDEYVEIDSLLAATSVLLTFTCRWCGVRSES
jgi:acetylornithine deacetylase